MKISIITATWNSGASLRDTMRSVLSQSFQDFEHIIVDGASTDNTLDIVRALEPEYRGRLKWISEKDRGLYDAMNKGIRMATGDVIGILNSDDFFTTQNVLERIAAEICDVSAVYGDVHYVHEQDLTRCVRYYSSASFRPWMMRCGFMPAHPSFYCRRDIYAQYGLFDLSFRVAADFEQLLRLIYINRISIKYIPMDFVTMRTGGASSSGFRSHRQIFRDHMRAYKKNSVYSNCLLESIRYFYKSIEVIRSRMKRRR
jgi:glycosyltransferase involved in cell wall biosynthesis